MAIRFKSLSYIYNKDMPYAKKALDNIDLEIKEGVIDDFTATWLEDDEFEFDGTAKCPEIDPTSYPADKVTVTYETKLATAEDTDYAAGGQINPGEYAVRWEDEPIEVKLIGR